MATATAADLPIVRTRAAWTRVGVLGLAAIAATPILMTAISVAAGAELGGDIAYFGVVAAVALVAAVLAWQFGTWAKVVGAVATFLTAGSMFWLAFGLTEPASTGDFVPAVTWAVGLVLGIGGNVAAVVRRRVQSPTAGSGERKVTRVAAGIVTAAVVASVGLFLASRSTVDAATAAGKFEVATQDFDFSQSTYTIDAGEEIVVANRDGFLHTFTIPALGIDQKLLPGSSYLIALDGEVGTYTIYCRPHADLDQPDASEAGMAATLHLQ